jgi:hypothetical protein
MTPVIRVADIRDGVFLHLTAVLEVLPPEAADLEQTVLDLREAFAPIGSDFDVLAVADKVGQSPTTPRELRRAACIVGPP